MNFSESVLLAGSNQKTVKEDLFVKGNHGISPHKQRGKTLEDSRKRITEAGLEPLTYEAGRLAYGVHLVVPRCYVDSPPP